MSTPSIVDLIIAVLGPLAGVGLEEGIRAYWRKRSKKPHRVVAPRHRVSTNGRRFERFLLPPCIYLTLFLLLHFTTLSDRLTLLFFQSQCFARIPVEMPSGDAFVDEIQVRLVSKPMVTELFSLTQESFERYVIQPLPVAVVGQVSGFRIVIRNGFITNAYRLPRDITMFARREQEILQNIAQYWTYTRTRQSRGEGPMVIEIDWANQFITVDVRNLTGTGRIPSAASLVAAQGFSFSLIQ